MNYTLKIIGYSVIQYMFFKNKVKNGKHVYNIENLNIKTNLDCMAFTSLLSISWSSFTGTKISILKLFNQLGMKICKCNLSCSKTLISHLFYKLGKTWKYTQPQTNISNSKCWIYGWVGKTYVLKLPCWKWDGEFT